MLIRKLTLMLFVVFSTTVYAEGKQPIDLDDPRPLHEQRGYNLDSGAPADKTTGAKNAKDTSADIFKAPETSGDDLTEHCRSLLDAADKLKGKPQRRWAAMERYKYECQSKFDRSPE